MIVAAGIVYRLLYELDGKFRREKPDREVSMSVGSGDNSIIIFKFRKKSINSNWNHTVVKWTDLKTQSNYFRLNQRFIGREKKFFWLRYDAGLR